MKTTFFVHDALAPLGEFMVARARFARRRLQGPIDGLGPLVESLGSVALDQARRQLLSLSMQIFDAELPAGSEKLRGLADRLRDSGEAVDINGAESAAIDLESRVLTELCKEINDALVVVGEFADDIEQLGDLAEEFEPSPDPDYDGEAHAESIRDELAPNAARALEELKSERAGEWDEPSGGAEEGRQ